jgi:8-oxo-dGTP pyrophosphatase MutT (NUDIX family)
MSRAFAPAVTVAAVIEHAGRFLMVEEETADGIRINQPAGHLDPGESLIQAVVREVLEETACHFEPAALTGVYLWRREENGTPSSDYSTYLRFAFAGSASAPISGRALDHGILRAIWLTEDELQACRATHRSPLVLQCIADYRRGQRTALDLLFTHASALR